MPANRMCLLSIALLTSTTVAQEYRIVPLELLDGPASSAYDISSNGWIVGRAEHADGWFRAVRWSPAGEIEELGMFNGPFSEAYGVNHLGQTVGHASLGNRAHAFCWTNGVMTDLGTLGDDNSLALRINSAGIAVGWAGVNVNDVHGCYWLPGQPATDLGTLGGQFSEARDINDHDQITGWGAIDDNNEHAFLWDPDTGMHDLGTVRGRFSYGFAINELSQVVGYGTAGGGQEHGFLWDPSSGMQDLGVLPGGDTSFALDINNRGVVVGWSDAGAGPVHATIWDSKNGLRDLNDLAAPEGDWILTHAEAINDSGVIAGWGWNIDAWRAYRLVPVCDGDWNKNGLLNSADFLAYLNDYNAVRAGGLPTFRHPDLAPPFGVMNTADVLAYLNLYTSGCS